MWLGRETDHPSPSSASVKNKWRCRLQLKCDGTRWRTGGEVNGKLANGVGSQYSSYYLGTWCIQHYYRWCAYLGCQSMDSSVSPKDEIWFLLVFHHISAGLYIIFPICRLQSALPTVRVTFEVIFSPPVTLVLAERCARRHSTPTRWLV
jgi:hypothetical protein